MILDSIIQLLLKIILIRYQVWITLQKLSKETHKKLYLTGKFYWKIESGTLVYGVNAAKNAETVVVNDVYSTQCM